MSRSLTWGRVIAPTLFTLALLAVSGARAQGQASLTIGITPGTDPNGEPTYTATVKNVGAIDAPNLTVTYLLPSGELPISPTLSGGCAFTPGPVHLTAICSIPNLTAGQSQDFTIAVHPVNTVPQDVTATATEAGGGIASAFITSTITAVGLAEMKVDLASTNPGKVGETFTYNLTVTNIQDDDARNVFSVLVLPKGSTWVSAHQTHCGLLQARTDVAGNQQDGDDQRSAHNLRMGSGNRRRSDDYAGRRLH